MNPTRIGWITALLLAGCGEAPHAPPPATPEVAVRTVATEAIDQSITLVGRCVPNQSVEVRARVSGTLLERPFSEGAVVQEGAVLFRIDPAEYAAELETARARLAQAEARREQARRDVARVEPLAKSGAAPVQELERIQTALLSGDADVRYAKAQVDRAALDLGYCTIAAPFTGKVGKSARDPGATIGPADGTLVSIDQVDPIAVEFAFSERDWLALRREIAEGRVVTPAPDQLRVRVRLMDGSEYPETGVISFRDVRVQPETGAALLRARFGNDQGRLVPGQFARVDIVGMTRPTALLVSQRSVVLGPTGASVWVVDADAKVQARGVTLGQWVGDRWLIDAGLSPGERVVVDGTQRLRAGGEVRVAEAPAAATAKPAPPAGGSSAGAEAGKQP